MLVRILFGVVGLVLLVACSNVAGLLVARTEERWHEISVRLAIGASRARLVWHLVAEYLVLATLGGVAGLVVAQAGITLLRAWVVPSSLDLPLDWRVAAFTLVLVGLTGTLISAWPALAAARAGAADSLRGARTSTTNRAIGRRLLVAVQLAVAVVLVVASGLALRTIWNISRV